MAVRHLIVKLTANTDAMSSGLSRGQKLVKDFGSKLNAISQYSLGIGPALAGAFGGYSVVTAIDGALTRLDALGDAAGRLSIDPRMLAGLQHAADLSDSSAATLTASLEKMNRLISEAASIGGPAADMIRALGLEVETLEAMAPDQAFYTIADAIAAIPDSGQQALAAFRLMGRQGAELVPLLRQGSEGLRKFQEDAERLGIAFSKEEVQKASDAKDALDRMKKAASGLANTIAIELSPSITQLAEDLTSSMDGVGQWVLQAEKLSYQFKLLVERMDLWILKKDREKAVWSIPIWGSKADEIREIDDMIADQTGYIAQLEAGLKDIEARIQGQDGVGTLDAKIDAASGAMQRGREATKQFADAFDDVGEKSKDAFAALEDSIKGIERALDKLPRSALPGFFAATGLGGLSGQLARFGATDRAQQAASLGRPAWQTELDRFASSVSGTPYANVLIEQYAQLLQYMERIAPEAERWAKAHEAATKAAETSTGWMAEADKLQRGLTERQAQMEAFRRSGGDAKTLAGMREADRILTAAEKEAERRKRGKEITEQNRTPAEEFAASMKELQTLLMSGDIGGVAAMRAARAAADQAFNVQRVDAPELKRAGSQEAYSAILKYQESQAEKTPDWAAKMLDWLEKIATATAQEAEQAPAKAENLF